MTYASNTTTHERVRLRWSIISAGAVVAAYLVVLATLDWRQESSFGLHEMLDSLPLLLCCSLVAFTVRYLRWRWLLRQRGYTFSPVIGFLSYLSGFALTVSPGKVGELLRIRYFGNMGVPAHAVVGCFVFERLMDLLVLLCFAALIARNTPSFLAALAFVVFVLASVISFARARRQRLFAQALTRRLAGKTIARIVRVVGRGLEYSTRFVRTATVLGSLIFGAVAWGAQALGFLYLVSELGIGIAWPIALAIQPAATLIGAASNLPGGIGSTELATTLLLRTFGAPLEPALLAAIVMRLATLWFSVLLGAFAIGMLEIRKVALRAAVPEPDAPRGLLTCSDLPRRSADSCSPVPSTPRHG